MVDYHVPQKRCTTNNVLLLLSWNGHPFKNILGSNHLMNTYNPPPPSFPGLFICRLSSCWNTHSGHPCSNSRNNYIICHWITSQPTAQMKIYTRVSTPVLAKILTGNTYFIQFPCGCQIYLCLLCFIPSCLLLFIEKKIAEMLYPCIKTRAAISQTIMTPFLFFNRKIIFSARLQQMMGKWG